MPGNNTLSLRLQWVRWRSRWGTRKDTRGSSRLRHVVLCCSGLDAGWRMWFIWQLLFCGGAKGRVSRPGTLLIASTGTPMVAPHRISKIFLLAGKRLPCVARRFETRRSRRMVPLKTCNKQQNSHFFTVVIDIGTLQIKASHDAHKNTHTLKTGLGTFSQHWTVTQSNKIEKSKEFLFHRSV